MNPLEMRDEDYGLTFFLGQTQHCLRFHLGVLHVAIVVRERMFPKLFARHVCVRYCPIHHQSIRWHVVFFVPFLVFTFRGVFSVALHLGLISKLAHVVVRVGYMPKDSTVACF